MINIVLLIALIVCLVGSVLIARDIRLREYASNRSKSSSAHVVFSVLGSLVGGWMFFGLCAIGYEAGIVGYAIGIGYSLGLLLLAKFIPAIKSEMVLHSCDTMDDLVGAKFGATAQLAVTVVNLFFFIAILAAQFIALSAFLEILTDLNPVVSYVVAVAVVILYTALAGFKGVLLTDLWQFIFLGLGALVVTGLLSANADYAIVARLPESHFNGLGYGPGFLAGVLILFPPSLLARTDLWQRIAAAESPKAAQRAFRWSAPVILIFYILLTTVGILARAGLGEGIQPETSGFVSFLEIVKDPEFASSVLVSEGLIAIIVIGVLAALLSTADTNLNVIAVAVAKILGKERWEEFEASGETPEKTELEGQLLRSLRLTALILGVVAVGVARAIPDIVNLIVAAGSSVMLFLPMVLTVLRKREVSARAALFSVIGGFFSLLIFLVYVPKIAFIPATLISFAIYHFMSRRN